MSHVGKTFLVAALPVLEKEMSDMATPSRKILQEEVRSGADGDIRARIGTRLKAYYEDILTQPVPDRFENLLRQLAEQSASPREQEKR